MFTGIIREIGTVISLQRANGLIRLTIQAPGLAARVQPLESMAVNGVCLSVVGVRRPRMTFEVIRETQRLTALGSLRSTSQVNLEPSLSLTDRLNGHLVFGHIDGMGAVVARRQAAGELVLTIRTERPLRKFLVPKGPVTIDGVSLTVGSAPGPTTFTVHLIPETLRRTTLRERVVGDRVNLEVDYLAKLVEQFVNSR